MFRRRKEQKQERQKKRQENYDRVYELHAQAAFLCYINDVYMEPYKGDSFVKLEGVVARGTGRVTDVYRLYDCNGRYKAEVHMEELYLGQNAVESLQGGDKRIALYPKEQDIAYQAGDLLCKLKEEVELKKVK